MSSNGLLAFARNRLPLSTACASARSDVLSLVIASLLRLKIA